MTDVQTVDSQNEIFSLALDLVKNTDQHVFLTGKAGTGKTTFLKHLVENCEKRLVVVAPTGVAAINAGGVTMHSQFNLPIEPLPYLMQSPGSYVFDTRSLFRNVRMSNQKIGVLKELELLVIDEISMVRADTLDLVDSVLRHYRRRYREPFGGVQVLYIGDMFQLPPILKPEEWEKLRLHYTGHFFFDARVMNEVKPIKIELTKIYRQKEESFIQLLNNVRNNQLQKEDFAVMEKLWKPTFEGAESGYVTLCTHNKTADDINFRQLDKLAGKSFRFVGEISGEFNERNLPAEMELVLKVGARVMFIRNDSNEEKRFYNGKQTTVTKIKDDEIYVNSGDKWGEFAIEKETWENISYNFDKEKDKISEELLGSFSQFPLRLAWAITIHKSQGLTFEKTVIDAGQSFSAGQVYVALSRCTSLDGLVLKSKIQPSAVFTDGQIVDFSKEVHESHTLAEILEREKNPYLAKRLVKAFTLESILEPMKAFQEMIPNKKIPKPEVTKKGIETMLENAKTLQETCLKTQKRLLELLNDPYIGPDHERFQTKVKSGIEYFSQQIDIQLLDVWKVIYNDLKIQKNVKGFIGTVLDLRQTIEAQKKRIQKAKLGDQVFFIPPVEPESIPVPDQTKPYDKSDKKWQRSPTKEKKAKQEVGSSMQASLDLFKKGKSVVEISEMRGFAVSTIESHLARFVSSGELSVEDLLEKEKIEQIEAILAEQENELQSGPVKSILGDAVSWSEIRYVMNAWRRRNAIESLT